MHDWRGLPLALVLVTACSGPRSPPPRRPLVWVSSRPLGALLPHIPRNGTTATLVDLVAVPLGRLYPGAMRCPHRTHCRIDLTPTRRFQDGTPVRPRDLVRVAARMLRRPATDASWYRVASHSLTLDLPRAEMDVIPWVPVAKPGPDGRWVGTGPYRILTQSPQRIRLRAVDPRHRPRAVVAEAVGGTRAVFSYFLAGRADVAGRLTVPQARIVAASGREGDSLAVRYLEVVLIFNERRPPFDSQAARRCLLARLGPIFHRWAHRTDLAPSPPALRAEARRAPAAPAGCPADLAKDRPPVTVGVLDFQALRMAAEALLADLADAGLPVRLKVVPVHRGDEPVSTDLRLSIVNLHNPQAPSLYVASDGRLNVGHHHDPALDAALATGAGWKDIAGLLAGDPPFVPLGIMPRVSVTSRRFRFVRPKPGSTRPFSFALAIRPARSH